MKNLFVFASLLILFSCKEQLKQTTPKGHYNIQVDSLTLVNIGDTFTINQFVCRACAFEQTTKFGVKDTANLVQLISIDESDHGDPNTDGGSMQRILILKAVKKGTTTFNVFKDTNFRDSFGVEDIIHNINLIVK
jgi:hypothetical protein